MVTSKRGVDFWWGNGFMKIEKINDRQIRCVLTKEDLEDRKIRLSELVCGGEKARGLLKDMMIQAARELGFSFNNNPLMIEAVPTGKDQLVLIITRVDDPGELDKRFRHLSGGADAGREGGKQDSDSLQPPALPGADDILKLLKSFKKRLEEQKAAGKEKADSRTEEKKEVRKEEKEKADEKICEEEFYRYTRFYLFRSLEHVLDASKRVPAGYAGENALYKNPDDGAFYLLVKKTDTDPEQFNRICNALSEYSMPMDYSSGMDEFFREHMQVIIAEQALQHMREV